MKDFLKYTLASLLGSLLGLVLLGSIGLGGLVLLIAMAASSSKDSGPQVKDKSVLVLDLSLNITDSKPSRSTGAAIQEALSDDGSDTVTLRTVLDAIESAKKDPKIVGIYLEGSSDSSSSGFANLKEVRSALQRFRDAKKPIFAYEMDWSERDYYLGSVANTIAVNPYGALELNGFSSQIHVFYRCFGEIWRGSASHSRRQIQVSRRTVFAQKNESRKSPANSKVAGRYLGRIPANCRAKPQIDRSPTASRSQIMAEL